jgi:hypothetical protein
MEVMNEKIKLVEDKKRESVTERQQKERAKNVCLHENEQLDTCREHLMTLRDLHTTLVRNYTEKLEEMKTRSELLREKEAQNIHKIDRIIGDFDAKIQNYTAMLDATRLAHTSYANAFKDMNTFANNATAQESYDQQMARLGNALHNYNAAVINNYNAFRSIQEFLKSNTVKDAMDHVAANEETLTKCNNFFNYCLEKGRDFLSGTVNPPIPGVPQQLGQQPQVEVSLPKEQFKSVNNGTHKVTEFCVGSLTHTMTFDLNVAYNDEKVDLISPKFPTLTGTLDVKGIKFAGKFRYMPSYCLSQDEKFVYIFGGYSKVIIKLNLASNEFQEVAVDDVLTKGTGIICNGKLIIIGAINYKQDEIKSIEDSKTSIYTYSADNLSRISKGEIANMKYIMSPGLIRLPEKDRILICGGETPVGDYDKVYKLNFVNSTSVEEAPLESPASFYPTKPYYFADKFCVLIDCMNKAHIYNMNEKIWWMVSTGSKNIEPIIKKLIL